MAELNELIIACGLAIVVGVVLGWRVRGIGAQRSEDKMKAKVLDSKGVRPRLEASLQTKDKQIEQQQHEYRQLQEQVAELRADLAVKTETLKRADAERRKLKNLVSLQNEHEDKTESGGQSNDVQALKAKLLEREEHIAELESTDLAEDLAEALDEVAKAKLREEKLANDLEEKSEAVTVLANALEEQKKESEMLAGFAKKRSEAKSEAVAQADEMKDQVGKLETSVAEKEVTIQAREKSISKLLAETRDLSETIRELNEAIADHLQSIEQLKATIAAKDVTIAQHSEELNAQAKQFRTDAEAREEQFAERERTLKGELQTVTSQLTTESEARQAREALVAKQRQQIQTTVHAGAKIQKNNASLKELLEARQETIRAQNSEIQQLNDSVVSHQRKIDELTSRAQSTLRERVESLASRSADGGGLERKLAAMHRRHQSFKRRKTQRARRSSRRPVLHNRAPHPRKRVVLGL